MLVKHVDEVDEAPRLVVTLGAQQRHASQHQRMELARDFNVIGGPERLSAQRLEGRPRDAPRRREVERAALDRERRGLGGRAVAEPGEGRVERRVGFRP